MGIFRKVKGQSILDILVLFNPRRHQIKAILTQKTKPNQKHSPSPYVIAAVSSQPHTLQVENEKETMPEN